MKKFFNVIGMLTLLAAFILPSSVLAAPIYNSSVDNFVGTLQNFGNQAGISFQGKDYRTTSSGKVCDVYFGGRQDNRITLGLNDNNTIDNIAINFPGNSTSENAELGGMAFGLILVTVGFNEQECNNFIEQLNADVANKPSALQKTYKIYCSAIQQNVNIDAVFDDDSGYFLVSLAD